MVFAEDPSNVVPEASPVPELLNVRELVVFAVIVPDPPRETDVPLNVTLEFESAPFGILVNVFDAPDIDLFVKV